MIQVALSKSCYLILALTQISFPSINGLAFAPQSNHDLDRRMILKKAASSPLLAPLLSTGIVLRPERSQAAIEGENTPTATTTTLSAPSLTVPARKSVIVLGSNGGTGRQCVSALLRTTQRPCIATTRRGDFVYGDGDDGATSSVPVPKNLSTASADVTSYESLSALLSEKGSGGTIGAVIFAASASAKGGDASSVDKDGVINAAKACIAAGISRFVVVSSGAVTRPDSAIYKLLNLVGKGIMEAKIAGEDEVRRLYSDPELIGKGLGYTIIRPGGLTNGDPVGPSGLELNQGDGKSGRLSRADVAQLCVECLNYPAAFDTTFECYELLTAKPLESVGISNILKQKDPTEFKTGRECQGGSWGELFQDLERDDGH